MKVPVEIIFPTMYTEEDAFNRAMETGVKGYVLKDSAATEIINGIKAVNDLSPLLLISPLSRSN